MKQSSLSVTMVAFSIFALVQSPSTTQAYGVVGVAAGSGGQAAASGATASTVQLGAAAGNATATKGYAKTCSSVVGAWACPLAVMAGITALQYLMASKKSSAAGADMSAWNGMGGYPQPGTGSGYDPLTGLPIGTGGNGNGGDSGGSGAGGNPAGGNGIGTAGDGVGIRLPDGSTAQSIERQLADARAELDKAGVKLSQDGKTVTTKDGRKFNIGNGADGSEKGFLDMGMSAAEASMAADASRRMNAQLASKYGSLMKIGAEGGGGGGRAPAAAANDSSDGMNGMRGFNFNDPNAAKNRAKPKLSGLTKKLGDDTIGVSGDDIFEMITRRYKARDQDNQFLKD